MPTPTLTLRLHPDTRAALEHQAAEVGLPLRTHIAQTLNTAAGVVVAATTTSGSNVTVTPQTTGMTVPSPAPKTSEPAAPIQAEAEREYAVDPATCVHPAARQRNVVGGKKCLDCGVKAEGFF